MMMVMMIRAPTFDKRNTLRIKHHGTAYNHTKHVAGFLAEMSSDF